MGTRSRRLVVGVSGGRVISRGEVLGLSVEVGPLYADRYLGGHRIRPSRGKAREKVPSSCVCYWWLDIWAVAVRRERREMAIDKR